MFKIMIPRQLYNIADEKTEYQINDRLSFQRFIGVRLNDKVRLFRHLGGGKFHVQAAKVE